MERFDYSKLRARVTQDFESFVTATTDADAMNGFVEAVMTNAVGTVRDLLRPFNEVGLMARIPPEVLAACFAHVPFSYRLSLSHVCQSWRAAALSTPELWSRITQWMSFKHPELLHMALSRAGAMPLYLDINVKPPTSPQTIYATLVPFSQQIRYLWWPGAHPDSPWDLPAPNMLCFCATETITITERFLGGTEGRLRYLYLQCAYLPDTCPVLATVTDLNIVLTPFDEGVPPSRLTSLWALFPRLEWLQILGMTSFAAHMLPIGQAPTSLREMSLHSMSMDYDLAPLYAAWDNGNLEHVSLSQYPSIPPNLERMAKGTVRLAVKYGTDDSYTDLMFEHSATVSHSVAVSQFNIADAAAALDAVQPHLSVVHTALISHTALRPLFAVLTELPNLEHLFVHIVPKTANSTVYQDPDAYAFAWSHLSTLAIFARAIRSLRRITLHVWCGGCSTPAAPNADDARSLIAQLRALLWLIPPVEIQGFPAEAVAGIDLTGLDVRFDFAKPVGELRFHEDREPWEPCW